MFTQLNINKNYNKKLYTYKMLNLYIIVLYALYILLGKIEHNNLVNSCA